MPYNKEQLLKQLGSRIKEEREANGISQQELAVMCNFEKSKRLEAGNTNLTFITLVKICRNLDISLSELLKNIDLT